MMRFNGIVLDAQGKMINDMYPGRKRMIEFIMNVKEMKIQSVATVIDTVASNNVKNIDEHQSIGGIKNLGEDERSNNAKAAPKRVNSRQQ